MSRRNWILFLVPVVIWSTTFYAITLQLGSVTKREGSARTMYISVLAPIGAVLISILWEGLQLQVLTFLGIVTALVGAWFTLSGKKA